MDDALRLAASLAMEAERPCRQFAVISHRGALVQPMSDYLWMGDKALDLVAGNKVEVTW